MAAYAAGQSAVVANVAAHELGAAAYAIKAARAAAPEGERETVGRLECRWQRRQLPDAIRELVLDDQRGSVRKFCVKRQVNRPNPTGQINGWMNILNVLSMTYGDRLGLN
jgi:hypothetical protein